MPKRVLIVDDALIMRKRIADIARRAGWEIAGEASNGAEALEMYRAVNPDHVTLDIVMPEVDGVTALEQVLATDPDARVVMVSAVDQREKLAHCIETGAIDFVVKPFDTARLQSLFERYLAS